MSYERRPVASNNESVFGAKNESSIREQQQKTAIIPASIAPRREKEL
jgi:hypothetical protein